ncbi:HNH endonuclease [Desulfosporosinus sp. FKB]|uniref:HNH endonuclease n=1 Tax=Desulfosporosinus sp. FKB TaxID=1969835 RepID=UPI000B49B65A|nr:HNH endonuclease [Desulfosporosinus sp. FKB]
MDTAENYVYKKEVDWSLLKEGLTLPVDNQVVFGRNIDRLLSRGESRNITLYLDGQSYKAKITNVNFDPKFNRRKDTLQIMYSPNGELSNALKSHFIKSYQFICAKRQIREAGDRTMIHLPDDCKEYLAIYTTEYEDTYLLETIVADDIVALKDVVKNQQERILEARFNYDMVDEKSAIYETERIVKLRKLNKKIGDNLKLLYNYRCQICGKNSGEEYGSQIVEAHHIDYFVHSLNNDSDNQLIVCPNHHSIIHDVNPAFDRKRLLYIFPNGLQEGLALNQHLGYR